ncbi:MAG: SiaB family protein kinase [Salinivirgaceae bacterium]|nr:SiaB family protein kinase [Salinivirgaceae bacterium]MDD4746499.1 SiaB family protein kinase [Salinivirgaceae bacterium]MDY0280131.1 SiaB family protein kinase [Salinivirgaceae bacterium]
MEVDINSFIKVDFSGEILFSFQGELTSSKITILLEDIETKLNEMDIDIKVYKKIYYICVESVQNLFHHSMTIHLNGSINEDIRFCSIQLFKTDKYYSIVTGNFVKEEKIPEIANHIESINGFSKDELKDYYKKILTNQEFSSKGGGGLGMIDIARKANNKYIYSFKPFVKETAFFKLQININQN